MAEQDGDLFRVDADSGKVLVNRNVLFDRENISQYIIKVRATDGAISARPNSKGLPNSRKSANYGNTHVSSNI